MKDGSWSKGDGYAVAKSALGSRMVPISICAFWQKGKIHDKGGDGFIAPIAGESMLMVLSQYCYAGGTMCTRISFLNWISWI